MKATLTSKIKKGLAEFIVVTMVLSQSVPAFAGEPIQQLEPNQSVPSLTLDDANNKSMNPVTLPAGNTSLHFMENAPLSQATPQPAGIVDLGRIDPPQLPGGGILPQGMRSRILLEETPEEVLRALALALKVEVKDLETRTYLENPKSFGTTNFPTKAYSVDVTVVSKDQSIESPHYVAWVEIPDFTNNAKPAPYVNLMPTPALVDVEAFHAVADHLLISGRKIEVLEIKSLAIPRCFTLPCPVFVAEVMVGTSDQNVYEGTVSKTQLEDKTFEYQVDLQLKDSPSMRQVRRLLADDLKKHHGLDNDMVDQWIKSGDISFVFDTNDSGVTLQLSDMVRSRILPQGKADLADLMGDGELPESIHYELGYYQQPPQYCPDGNCPVMSPIRFIMSATFQIANKRFDLNYLSDTQDGMLGALGGDNQLYRVNVSETQVCSPGAFCLPAMEPLKSIIYTYGAEGSITGTISLPGPLGIDDVRFMEVDIKNGYIQQIRDYGTDKNLLAISYFNYELLPVLQRCRPGLPCDTKGGGAILESISRKDVKGGLLSETTILESMRAVVKVDENKADIQYSDLMNLLEQIRRLEGENPRIRVLGGENPQNRTLAQIGFGSRGNVIVKSVVEDGVVHYIAIVQVMADYATGVYPGKVNYIELARFELAAEDAFQILPGFNNPFFRQEGLRINTIDGKTVTFWNRTGSFSIGFNKSFNSAYYTIEENVYSDLYQDNLKRTQTFSLFDDAINGQRLLKISDNLGRLVKYTWTDADGVIQTSQYEVSVQNMEFTFDGKGNLSYERVTRRTDDGSSATLTKNYIPGSKDVMMSLAVSRKGQPDMKYSLKTLDNLKSELSGLILLLEGTRDNSDGVIRERPGIKVTFNKDTLEVEIPGGGIGLTANPGQARAKMLSSLSRGAMSAIPAMILPVSSNKYITVSRSTK